MAIGLRGFDFVDLGGAFLAIERLMIQRIGQKYDLKIDFKTVLFSSAFVLSVLLMMVNAFCLFKPIPLHSC
jgi:hypothetical protein